MKEPFDPCFVVVYYRAHPLASRPDDPNLQSLGRLFRIGHRGHRAPRHRIRCKEQSLEIETFAQDIAEHGYKVVFKLQRTALTKHLGHSTPFFCADVRCDVQFARIKYGGRGGSPYRGGESLHRWSYSLRCKKGHGLEVLLLLVVPENRLKLFKRLVIAPTTPLVEHNIHNGNIAGQNAFDLGTDKKRDKVEMLAKSKGGLDIWNVCMLLVAPSPFHYLAQSSLRSTRSALCATLACRPSMCSHHIRSLSRSCESR